MIFLVGFGIFVIWAGMTVKGLDEKPKGKSYKENKWFDADENYDDGISDEELFFLSQADPDVFEMALTSKIRKKRNNNYNDISDEELLILSKTNPELFKACMYSRMSRKR